LKVRHQAANRSPFQCGDKSFARLHALLPVSSEYLTTKTRSTQRGTKNGFTFVPLCDLGGFVVVLSIRCHPRTASHVAKTRSTLAGCAPAPNSHWAMQPPSRQRWPYTWRTAASTSLGVAKASRRCRSISPQKVILPAKGASC